MPTRQDGFQNHNEVSYSVRMGTCEAKLVITASSLIFVQHYQYNVEWKRNVLWKTIASHLWFYILLDYLLIFLFFLVLGKRINLEHSYWTYCTKSSLYYGSLNFTLPSYHRTVWSLSQIRRKILRVSTLSDFDATLLQELHIGFLLKLYTRHGSFKCVCFTP